METKKIITVFIAVFLYIASFGQLNESFKSFEINLDIMSNRNQPGLLTAFIGLDMNFSSGRLFSYLQSDFVNMTPVDQSWKVADGKMTLKFVPRVSSSGDYIIVNFYFKDTPNVPSVFKTDNGLTSVVNKVEITGTTDKVVNLFLYYWPSKINIGGYKIGEIANYQFLGDYITLSGIDQNKAKIVIQKGNIDFDYYTTYNIN